MNFFEKICELAIELKEEDIKAFIRENNISIDVFKPKDNMSAAEFLTIERKLDAVNLLLHLGADPSRVARGAAREGNFSLVNYLLHRNVSVSHVAQGFAQGGPKNWRDIKEYREKLSIHYQLGASIDAIAIGAIQGEDFDFADEMRLGGADINLMASTAAAYGYEQFANYLRDQGADPNWIALGRARGGYSTEDLRQEGVNINYILQGAALGGLLDEARSLIEEGADPEWAVEAAMQGGYFFFAEECRIKARKHINYFDKIYTLAKEGKKDELLRLLKDPFISIDVRKQGTDFTAAERLAFEKIKLQLCYCWS